MPNAISIAPSQEFEGNDGNWSTFSMVVGTGPKPQRILPATSSEYVALVSPLGCVNTFNAGPSTACEFSRGGTPFLFNTSNSLTWTKLTAADGSKNFYLPFDSEQKLGNAGPGQVPASVGLDTVAFNLLPSSTTPNLPSQVVAVYNAVNPWIGMLGVRGIPNHLPLADSTSQASVLQALKAAGTVPSVYFGYTAGKYYKSPQVFGSLTLGGYDGSRVDMSTALSVPISGSTTSDLSVYIKSITLSASGNRNTIPVGQFALIDSVVPEIWLPDTVCDQVELALGLVYDKATQLYLVNDTLRTNLQNAAPSFTFNLAASGNSSNSIPITLPYGAFDQTARFPFAGINSSNPTRQQRYFPLRRSNTTTGFFLGRTFLQEAYLTADYEAKVLTIGVARDVSETSTSGVVTIGSSSSNSSPTPTAAAAPLGAGVIAGIAIGALAGVALIGALIFFLWRRRRQAFLNNNTNKKKRPRYHQTPSSVGDTTLAADSEFGNVDEQRRHVMGEYFKPGNEFGPPPVVGSPPGDDPAFFKSELDATQTVSAFHAQRQAQLNRVPQPAPVPEMHELDGGSARPVNHRSPISWGSAVSAISPMNHDEQQHFQTLSQLREAPSPDPNAAGSPGTSPAALVSPNDRHISSDSVPPLRIPHERQLSSDSVPRPLRPRHMSQDSVPGLHEMQ